MEEGLYVCREKSAWHFCSMGADSGVRGAGLVCWPLYFKVSMDRRLARFSTRKGFFWGFFLRQVPLLCIDLSLPPATARSLSSGIFLKLPLTPPKVFLSLYSLLDFHFYSDSPVASCESFCQKLHIHGFLSPKFLLCGTITYMVQSKWWCSEAESTTHPPKLIKSKTEESLEPKSSLCARDSKKFQSSFILHSSGTRVKTTPLFPWTSTLKPWSSISRWCHFLCPWLDTNTDTS